MATGSGGEGGGETRAAGVVGGGHDGNGTPTARVCQAIPMRWIASGRSHADVGATLGRVPHKDPHAVLGVEPGASPDEIKAAWRALARRHHPDLTGDDPELARRATRRMAEINAAYAALTRAGETIESQRRRRAAGAAESRSDGDALRHGRGHAAPRRSAPAPQDPPRHGSRGHQRHRPSAEPDHDAARGSACRSPASLRCATDAPPRSCVPRSRRGRWSGTGSGATSRPEPPELDDALETEVTFGKFHGHTLGEIAAFEPSYIDWLAGTMMREPEIAMAARVIVAELDRRGIRRVAPAPAPGLAVQPVPLGSQEQVPDSGAPPGGRTGGAG